MNPKTRVLIVDDDVAMAKYLAAHLSRRNFEVTVASSEQEALRIFRSFDPVLVLVETSMDGEAGNDTLATPEADQAHGFHHGSFIHQGPGTDF